MVLKEANFVQMHNGPERSQFLMICLQATEMVLKEVKCYCVGNGLERSQFYTKSTISSE